MPSDTAEKRTIFIRNLPFDVNHDQLHAFFSDFAPLEFAKVVVDPLTQHSRGTGFVKFSTSEDAERVLQLSTDPCNASQFTLNHRCLLLSLAVSREEAKGLKKVKPETESVTPVSLEAGDLRQSGRNLHLARVGIVRAGTEAAQGLSREDLIKRETLLRINMAKLRNPNIFISDKRLCIRNLPLSLTEVALRKICRKAASGSTGPPARITECRIMRNLKPGKQQFRSLGYAFISFTVHQHALAALTELNNNPNVFDPPRRPIVEFSLENMRALELKSRRAERSKVIRLDGDQFATSPRSKKVSKKSLAAVDPEGGTPRHPSVRRRLLPKSLKVKHRHRQRSAVQPQASGNKPTKNKVSRQQRRLRKATQMLSSTG